MKKLTLLILFTVTFASFAQTPAADTGAPSGQAEKLKTSFTHFFRPVIGAGFNFRTDDFIDFKASADGKTLLTENDSKFRVAGTAGFWIPWSACGVKWEHWLYEDQVEPATGVTGESPTLPKCYDGMKWYTRWRMRSGLLTMLQLNQGNSNTAFSLGYGFMIRPGVILHGSYTRSLGKELSYGFRQAARALANNPQSDKAFDRWRGLFNQTDLTNLKDWDGFPLKYGASDTAVFPGTPIIDSYNGSVTFGVAIPLDRIFRTSDNK